MTAETIEAQTGQMLKDFRDELTKMAANKNWTRAEKIATTIALLSACGTIGNFLTNHLNRQDAQSQTSKTQSNELTDNRIENKLAPMRNELRVKADETAVKKETSDIRDEVTKGLDGIRSEIEKSNNLVSGVKEDVAKLTGRVDGIDKNVNLLLGHQLRAIADLPAPALAAQISNVELLYKMADQRSVAIPNLISDLIRVKLGQVEPSGPDYWWVASTTISRVSATLAGPNRPIRGTLHDPIYSNNVFTGWRVILDGSKFLGNTFDRCVIEYHGGRTEAQNNIFRDCLFIISLPETPPPSGQRFVMALLSSNLHTIVIN